MLCKQLENANGEHITRIYLGDPELRIDIYWNRGLYDVLHYDIDKKLLGDRYLTMVEEELVLYHV